MGSHALTTRCIRRGMSERTAFAGLGARERREGVAADRGGHKRDIRIWIVPAAHRRVAENRVFDNYLRRRTNHSPVMRSAHQAIVR